MESLSRQPDLDRLLYPSAVAGSSPSAGLDSAGHIGQATAATVLTPEKADAGDRAEVQIKLVDKLQPVTSPVQAAAIGGGAVGENLDATTSQLSEEAGAALDLAQRRALLLGRTKQRHVCLQCGRECPSKHKLKRHLSTHSEQRPYNCPLCGKSFKWTEYLAKHMRTQHPGVEVPAFASHGTSSSPSQDCISPTTPTSTSPSLTNSQLTPVGKQHKVATGDDSSVASSDLKEGISLGSDALGTGSIDESPITVYKNSNLANTITTHTALLTKTTLSDALPLTNDLLHQQQQQQSQTQNQHQSPGQSQQMMQPLLRQQEMLQLQQQKQQEQKEVQQQLLQQQIQQHQRQQQLQQQMQNQQATAAQVPQHVLQQKQQPLQMPQVVLQQQQPQRQQLQLTQQELLQPTDLQTPHSLRGHMQQQQQKNAAEQTYTTASGSPSSAQSQQVDTDVTTQMGGGGGSSLLHPLTHVMNSEASIQSMGFVGQAGEAYDQTVSTSMVYNATDGYQESSSSQVFTSPVYNAQSVNQVYQIPSQSQSAQLSSENFVAQSEAFSSAGNTANYVTTLTSLSPAPRQEVSGQQQGPGMEAAGFVSQQPMTEGGSDIRSMEQMSLQSQQNPEPNVLHMQAQITQSAYELQSVQIQPTVMSSSIQTYDGTGMMQSSANYQDNSAGTYQDGTNSYQEGTNTYQTGTNVFAMQEGPGYQDGASYQDQSQAAAQSQTISSLTTSYTDTDSLNVKTARQMYPTSVPAQDHQQLSFGSATTVSGVGPYNSHMSLPSESHLRQAPGVYGSLTTDTFHQMPTPSMDGSSNSGGVTLQSQPQMTAGTNVIPAEHQQVQGLHAVSQVETAVTQQQTGDNEPTLAVLATSTSSGHGTSEKTSKKSQKPKVSVGTQCEVGPETFRALKEEEAQAKSAGNTPAHGSTHESAVLDTTPVSMLQTPISSSLLLSSSETPSVQDVLNASSTPSANMSACEVTPTSQSDKVIRKYPCEMSTCAKAYVHRKDLIRHMALRHGMSPQKLEPVVIETPEKPYTCQVGTCRKSYFHQKDLRRHQRQCHSVTDNSNVQDAVEMTDADGKVMVRFPCDFSGCQRSYVHKKDLVRHKRVYHKDESKKPSIPVPVKFTEADLKRIRHEEKSFQDKETPNTKKPRLDSTGSIMSSGEDQSHFSEMAAMQISEAVDITQLSTASPTPGMEQHSTHNQVTYDALSSASQEISEEEASQLTNAELGLNMSQQQQSDQALQRQGTQQTSQQGGVNLPTILRRQRPGSNGQLTTLTSQEQQEQQQQQELALRNLASLMLGGLQGNGGAGGGGSGTQFDITQQTMAAFSSLPAAGSETTTESTTDAQHAAVAQFDPAAIISALSNVVNNPDILQTATPLPATDQQQVVVSMENVTNALQYLTSTSNSTQ